jgi:hypothetical protein
MLIGDYGKYDNYLTLWLAVIYYVMYALDSLFRLSCKMTEITVDE